MTRREGPAWERHSKTSDADGTTGAGRLLAVSASSIVLASSMAISCGTDPATADSTASGSEALRALSISGVISSAQGPIVGATVDLSGSVAESVVSGPGGVYTFSNLPLLGSYEVSLAAIANCTCSSPIDLHNLRYSVTGEDFVVMGTGCGAGGKDSGAEESPPPVTQCTQCPPGAQGVAGPAGPPGPAGPASKIDSLVGNAAAISSLPNATAAATNCVLGQILLFPFSPQGGGLLAANGQLLPIATNVALFSLLGTTFGGDGASTFGLPNLNAVAPNNTGYFICGTGVFP